MRSNNSIIIVTGIGMGVIMAIYWIMLVCAAAVGVPLCGLHEKKSDTRLTVYCIAAAAAFTVISAVRLSVGYDYNLYAGLFYDMNYMDYADIGHIQREMGLLLPVKVTELFTYDYVPGFVLISLMIYPPLMIYVRKYSDNPWISVFAFLAFGLFFNSLNFMRQFIAALICSFAYRYAEKGRLGRFCIFVLLAAAFHRSAFLVLPCFLFAYIAMNGISLAAVSVTGFLVYMLSDEFVRFITQYVYTNYRAEYSNEIVTGLPWMYTVMYGVLFLSAFLLRNHIRGSEREKNMLMWCSFAAFYFELLGTKHGIVSRLALLFFIPAAVLLVPKVFDAVCILAKEKSAGRSAAAIAAAVIMITAMSGMYYGLLSRNYNGVVPYRTVFSREDGGL